MVLKVVTGKILRTLELSCWVQSRSIRDAAACGSIVGRREELKAGPAVGWSEIIDYLLGDCIVLMLSDMKNQVKGKMEGLRARLQIGNLAPTLSSKERGKGWGGCDQICRKWRLLEVFRERFRVRLLVRIWLELPLLVPVFPPSALQNLAKSASFWAIIPREQVSVLSCWNAIRSSNESHPKRDQESASV